MITITLDSVTEWDLAAKFADTIIAECSERRLARIDPPCLGRHIVSSFKARVASIRKMLASIDDKTSRKQFINDIRWNLKELRHKRDYPATWQEFLARVDVYEARKAASAVRTPQCGGSDAGRAF